jgi:uncharacterized membrane protein
VATFAYSAAGLYTVGVSGGNRTAAFPRLAVSGAIVLLFASLGLLVFFADHLLHSIQVDAIMETVQRNTLAVIEEGLLTGGQQAPEPPAWAVPVLSRHSGYVQAVRPRTLLPCAARHGVCLRLRPRVGEHVVAGTALAWIWRTSPADPAPDPAAFARILDSGVRIGFERTLEQDAAFGIRQLVDVACKALSPAVNDPYTAVQAVDHLSVIFCALARQPLGPHVARDGSSVVIVPARRFGDYLAVMCGLIRRYGASEPTIAHALLRLLGNCASVCGDDSERRAAIAEQARIIVADADREVAQPADLGPVHGDAEAVFQAVARRPPTSRLSRPSGLAPYRSVVVAGYSRLRARKGPGLARLAGTLRPGPRGGWRASVAAAEAVGVGDSWDCRGRDRDQVVQAWPPAAERGAQAAA